MTSNDARTSRRRQRRRQRLLMSPAPAFEAHEVDLHGHRVDLPDRRQRAAGRPDPRDGQLLAPLGGGRASGSPADHTVIAPGPDRPRRLGDAARRLLARRARGEHPRPARRDRRRARDDRRPLARRRRRDAVLLPVPPAHASGSRWSPAAASAARSARCCAARRCPARRRCSRLAAQPRAGRRALRRRRAAARRAASGKGVYLQAIARALRPLQEPGARDGLPADAARGDRRPRPAGQRPRPPLPARRDADADRLGRARPHDPDRARARRRTRRSPAAASRRCRAPPTSRTSRTPTGSPPCSRDFLATTEPARIDDSDWGDRARPASAPAPRR